MSAVLQEETPARAIFVFDLYCRMSVGDDGTVFKCEDQERTGRQDVAEWAREKGLSFGPTGHVQIGEVIYDHARSAWKLGVERKGFERIMDRAEAGDSQGVWVRDVDRYTRKMHEAVRIADAGKGGAIVLGHRSEYDLSSRKDRKRFLTDAMDAEDESSRISERSKDGVEAKAKRGRPTATQRGFARDGYLPNVGPDGGKWQPGDPRVKVPAEQLAREVQLVREAADRILTGTHMATICREWNEAGVLTTRGNEWDTAILRKMLTAPAMAGIVEYRGKHVGVLPGEPILDRETWDRLLLNFKSRKRGRPTSAYLLSGLMVCAKCGGTIYGRPQGHRAPYEDGEVRRQYWCALRIKGGAGCGANAIDQRFADSVVKHLVLRRLSDPKQAEKASRAASRIDAELTKARALVTKLEGEAKSLASKIGTGDAWTPDAVAVPMAAYSERIAEAKKVRDRLVLAKGGATEADEADAIQLDWDDANLDERRRLVRKAFPEGLVLVGAVKRGRSAYDTNRIKVGSFTTPE